MLRKNKILGAQEVYANSLEYIDIFYLPAGWQTKTVALAEFEKINK